MQLVDIEIGAVLLGAWVASLLILWVTIDRRGRPGLVKNALLKDVMMLVSVAMLVSGVSFVILGTGLAG